MYILQKEYLAPYPQIQPIFLDYKLCLYPLIHKPIKPTDIKGNPGHVSDSSRVTYTTDGQYEAHRVQHSGGDGAGVKWVSDALVVTEKAPLIGLDFTQVKGRQRKASCGWKKG